MNIIKYVIYDNYYLIILDSQLDEVSKLLEMGIGDVGRLESIKSSYKKNRTIYVSDRKYVQKLVNQYLTDEIRNDSPKIKPTKTSSESIIEEKSVEDKMEIEFCGKCGNKLKEQTNFCPKCGSFLSSNEKQSESTKNIPHNNPQIKYQRGPEWKSESTTLILSIILGIIGIQGVGHIYVGKVGKGIGILIVSIIMFAVGILTVGIGIGAIFLIIYIIMFFWQINNSRVLCKEYNDYLEKNGNTPW